MQNNDQTDKCQQQSGPDLCLEWGNVELKCDVGFGPAAQERVSRGPRGHVDVGIVHVDQVVSRADAYYRTRDRGESRVRGL